MRTITFFSPKGGAGRTTVLMAMAAKLVASGTHISVLELSRTVGPCDNRVPSTLKPWEELIANSPVGHGSMTVSPVHDEDSMRHVIREALDQDREYLLIDTPSRPNDMVMDMLQMCDVIIAPAKGAMEAAFASDWFFVNSGYNKLAFGLVTGAVDQNEESQIRAAFHSLPVLKTAVPHSDVFGRQLTEGNMVEIVYGDNRDKFELHDRVAVASAGRLIMELDRLFKNPKAAKRYPITAPLAISDPMAHLRELSRQNPQLLQ